jgi:hypothetical protein
LSGRRAAFVLAGSERSIRQAGIRAGNILAYERNRM